MIRAVATSERAVQHQRASKDWRRQDLNSLSLSLPLSTAAKTIFHTLDTRDQLLDHVTLRTRALLQDLDLPFGNLELLGDHLSIPATTIDTTI